MTLTNRPLANAVETLTKQGLSEREAQVYALREWAGRGRREVAQHLQIEPSTVDTVLQRARDKAPTLPAISKIDMSAESVRIWFDNSAWLQYRVQDDETIVEEVATADDPHSVHFSADLCIGPDELQPVALESIAEYVNSYQTSADDCRRDWPNVFTALTLF
jgi:hypothetical protein